MAAAGQRYLPRGWRDLWLQLGIWFGFLAAYQLARGLADRSPTEAFANGLKVVDLERQVSSKLVELSFQQFVDTKDWLAPVVSWTYWNSEFTVLGLTLLWVYLRRHESFTRLRNTILLANVIGLVGYVAVPTAPPRMLGIGFVNEHRDGLVTLAANPYAAMPSLHAADALVLGVVLAFVCRSWWAKAFWALWPAWVWFAVMATGNHFWLDCVAGMAVALAALAVVYRRELLAACRL
jgi:membrane-associated phospholipid phosphatase